MFPVTLAVQVDLRSQKNNVTKVEVASPDHVKWLLSRRSSIQDVDLSRVVVSKVVMEQYASTHNKPLVLSFEGELGSVTEAVETVVRDPDGSLVKRGSFAILMPFASESGKSYESSGTMLGNSAMEQATQDLQECMLEQERMLRVPKYSPCYPRACMMLGNQYQWGGGDKDCIIPYQAGDSTDLTMARVVAEHMQKDAVVDMRNGIRIQLTPLQDAASGPLTKGQKRIARTLLERSTHRGSQGDGSVKQGNATLVLSFWLGAVEIKPATTVSSKSAAVGRKGASTAQIGTEGRSSDDDDDDDDDPLVQSAGQDGVVSGSQSEDITTTPRTPVDSADHPLDSSRLDAP